MIVIDWIMLALIGAAVVSTGIAVWRVGDRKILVFHNFVNGCITKQRIDTIIKKRNFYIRQSVFWMMLNYAISILSISANIIVLYICAYGRELKEEHILIYTIISLCLTVFLLSVNPQSYYRRFRKAFRVIDNAINEIENDLSCKSNSDCVCKDNKCEDAIIAKVNEQLKNIISKCEDNMDE